MLIALISIALALAALVMIMLGVVVFGIRQEPRDTELSSIAPSPMAVVVRRLLGVHVRRTSAATDSAAREEGSDTRPATTRTKATTHPPGQRR